MNREDMLKVVEELRMILVEKEVTPNEAECIASLLNKKVSENNENEKKRYMREGKFR